MNVFFFFPERVVVGIPHVIFKMNQRSGTVAGLLNFQNSQSNLPRYFENKQMEIFALLREQQFLKIPKWCVYTHLWCYSVFVDIFGKQSGLKLSTLLQKNKYDCNLHLLFITIYCVFYCYSDSCPFGLFMTIKMLWLFLVFPL